VKGVGFGIHPHFEKNIAMRIKPLQFSSPLAGGKSAA
jgi:hypothetical protein